MTIEESVQDMVKNIKADEVEMTIEDLKTCFLLATEVEASFVAVKIKMDDFPKEEIIINPIENAEKKLEYYLSAYNKDLTLKSCNKIKIIAFTYGDDFEEIQADLMNEDV